MNAVNNDMVRELCVLTTRDEAGRHFTQWSEHWEALEDAGLIAIHRPVHDATGIPYGQHDWSLDLTDDGEAMVASHPELHPAE